VYWHARCKPQLGMKSVTTFALAVGLILIALTTLVLGEEHYVYRKADGKLVISNKPPSAGSKVLKKLDLIDGKQPGEDRDRQPQNPEASPKPSPDSNLSGAVNTANTGTGCTCHSLSN
jgi:hypothetical protein